MEPNTRLGSYTLGERLGQGAMADVFMAIQPGIDRTVAIKVMHPHLAARDEFGERFLREARAMGRLQHPHIARVIDFDTDQGHDFMVMEYLAGGSLDELLDRNPGPMPIPDAVAIARQLADALQYAHASGMVHRDLKPGNVMFTDAHHRHAVLTDFGIARLADASMTASGIMLGTPAYMAPEQARGERAEAAADQYSLGVMLFEMVTGEQPFTSGSLPGLILSHLNDPVPSARERNPSVSFELDEVIGRAMAKEPVDRFPDAAAFRAALEAAVRSKDFGQTTARGATVAVAAAGTPSSVPAATAPERTPPEPAAPAPTVLDATVLPARGGSPPAGPATSRTRALVAAAAVGIVAILGVAFAVLRGGGDDPIDDVAVSDAADDPAPAQDEVGGEAEGGDPLFEPTVGADESAGDATAAATGDATDQADGPEDGTPAFVPSFDPEQPPPLFVTTARILDERLIVGFDRVRQPRSGTRYLAWVDTVAGPVGEVSVDDRGLGRLDATIGSVTPTTFRISEEGLDTAPSAPTGRIVYSAGIDGAGDVSGDTGSLVRALADAERELILAQDHQQLLRDAVAADDLVEVRRHAEHVVNILTGADGPDFGDLDGSGIAENPGDDVGVRGHLEQVLEVAETIRAPGSTTLSAAASSAIGLLPAAQREFLRVIAADSPGEVDVGAGEAALSVVEAELSRASVAQAALLAAALVTDTAPSHPGSVGLAPAGDAVVVSFAGGGAAEIAVDFGPAGPEGESLDELGLLVAAISTDQWAALGDVTVASAGPSAAGILAGSELPPQALEVVTELSTGDEALLSDLGGQAQLMFDHVGLIRSALDAGNLVEARRHAEHVVNIVEGSGSERFGDLDASGRIENPGDDVGVLTYLDRIDELADTIPVSSDVQLFHLTQWHRAVDGVRSQVLRVVDRTVRVLASDSIVEARPFVTEALASATLSLDGTDVDGNGVVDLFAGELGVRGLPRQAPMLLNAPLVTSRTG